MGWFSAIPALVETVTKNLFFSLVLLFASVMTFATPAFAEEATRSGKKSEFRERITQVRDEKKKQILLVTPKDGKGFENVLKASRNIEGVSVIPSNLLNTYEVLVNKQILFMKNSIDSVKETFLKEKN